MTPLHCALSILLVVTSEDLMQNRMKIMARELVGSFNAGDLEGASKYFSPSLRAVVTPEALASLKESADSTLGKFRSIAQVDYRKENNLPTVEVVCRYEKAAASFRVAFDSEGRIAAIYLDPILSVPPDPALEAAAREVLSNFVAGNLDAMIRRFDANLRATFTPVRLADLRAKVARSYGAFQSVTEVRATTYASYRTIYLISRWDQMSVSLSVVFDKDGKVVGLKLVPASAL